MQIELYNAGKHFNRKWIFRNINYIFCTNTIYGITGENGSGKSTLLKLIGNMLDLSEGNVVYKHNDTIISKDIYKYISFATPYHALIEEFNLYEMLKFHFKFKKISNNYSIIDLIKISELENHANKTLATFSTGMKQRVKLLLSLVSETNIVLLDEPTTNFDAASVEWFYSLLKNYISNKIVIICSNHNNSELNFCNSIIDINEYKKNCGY